MMEIQKAYLIPNPYSRTGTKMGEIKGSVIHWVERARLGNQEAIYYLWTLYRPLCESWAKKNETHLLG